MSTSMSISTLSSSTFPNSNPSLSLSSQKFPLFSKPLLLLPFPHPLSIRTPTFLSPLLCKSPEAEAEAPPPEDHWLQKLPEKSKPLYSHSLPCIEAWLRSLGFCQSTEDRALWLVHKPDWHAHLSLDVTDLYIRLTCFCIVMSLEQYFCKLQPLIMRRPGARIEHPLVHAWYLKSGPGNLEKDVERRFSYALSREDIENAVLGGP
ncbi:hypothetical protein V8G54_011845 [Vigna mungo]|uniref:Uncharacterized protein n=1 Tax=Vigna mungo TaxID=3915 RepID=A0AAQ3NQ43_VIGMU